MQLELAAGDHVAAAAAQDAAAAHGAAALGEALRRVDATLLAQLQAHVGQITL